MCLNIGPEHLDHHGTMDKLQATFEFPFLQHSQDSLSLRRLPELSPSRPEVPGPRSRSVFPENRTTAPPTLSHGAAARGHGDLPYQQIGVIELIIPGKQNVTNALAAIAVAMNSACRSRKSPWPWGNSREPSGG